jgi:hypothetical protein
LVNRPPPQVEHADKVASEDESKKPEKLKTSLIEVELVRRLAEELTYVPKSTFSWARGGGGVGDHGDGDHGTAAGGQHCYR